MSQINIQGLVNNIANNTNVYTPIIEAVVNSIQAIEETRRTDGEITIALKRDAQGIIDLDENSIPKVVSIEVHDNGIGFNQANRDSFDTLYSNRKNSIGGKGFGRFMFLKYFDNVQVDSTFVENEKFYQRTFSFSCNSQNIQDLVENEKLNEYKFNQLRTVVFLNDLKDKQVGKFDKRIETIARVLVEKLLPYFINEKYKCPTITLEEYDGSKKIVLNDYLNEYDGIKLISTKKFDLLDGIKKEEFEVKIFKIFYTQRSSSIILTAHNRAVSSVSLHEYVPEFKDDFYDRIENKDGTHANKNYSIKAYVLGDYLNQHVLREREDFSFGREKDLHYPFGKKEIETKTIDIIVEEFKDEVLVRKEKKRERVIKYVDNTAPWHKLYVNEFDLSNIPYQFDDVTIEGELQKLKFEKELSVKSVITQILKDESDIEVLNKIKKISNQVLELGKSDLTHYVILRRIILDLLKKGLKWDDSKVYEKEKVIHELIFPLNTDSDHLPYDKHNLWVIDERLSFHEYTSSDQRILRSGDRPDILTFDKPISVREGDDLGNPISVFEFKRPQRIEYDEDEDPLLQIMKYVDQIRKGQLRNIDGRAINASEHTPAYGFLICDLTEKIRSFCRNHQLTETPDNQGYIGYHQGYRVYLEVISFDKLVRDAELRNKIFFKKLGIE